MAGLGILFLFVVQAAAGIPAADVPAAPGVYFRQEGGWIQLRPAVTADAGASGLDLFIGTGGYTDLEMSIACAGPRASARAGIPKPELFIRAIGVAGEAMLVRLSQKKDKRICRTSYSNVTVGNKHGFQKKDIFRLFIREYQDGSFSVSPEKDLPPGEYLLVLGNALPVFDFGIDRGKR